MEPKILITGATGKTGFALVERLARLGVPFRALVHSKAKAQLLKKRATEIAYGDFGKSASIEQALEGIDKVYLVSPPSPDQFRIQAGFVDTAKRNGVKRIVKLSALGAALDSPVGLLRSHAQLEEYIRKSGISWTFLRPHFFMENLLGYAPAVRKESAIYSPLGDTPISPISIKDIAAVAAAVLISRGHADKAYDLTGPKAVTHREIAAVLSEVLGKKICFITVPYEDARQGMVESGMPGWLADDLIRLMRSWSERNVGIVTPDAEKILNRKPVSIREFFRSRKELFIDGTKKAA